MNNEAISDENIKRKLERLCYEKSNCAESVENYAKHDNCIELLMEAFEMGRNYEKLEEL